jgi:ATP-dependent exoDNAse (exonuclease V) beta subunit
LAVADSPDACAAAVADEIQQLVGAGTVRDKTTGLRRPARAGDIAILFRSRSSHREFERELGARGIATYVYKGLGFFDADEIKDITALIRFLADPSSALRVAAFLRSRFVRLSDAGLAALAPDFSSALLSAEQPASLTLLEEEDRRVLDLARAHVHDWLSLVDRITPSELLDRILADTAYAFELNGVRLRQARENVKKMRGLVRRMQNRGYAIVSRIAEHLMSLTAGDESNAVIEALDAVNLMTVHASKGLEFPIVFVVNLSKGASGPPRPVRVITGSSPDDAELSVTVGPFLSETDDAERERERHETRRLLYVALTRARDRLYLSTTLKEGALAAGRGSLAEVLPESLRVLFVRAGAVFDEVETIGWTGISGHEYAWRLCRPTGTTVPKDVHESSDHEVKSAAPDDFFSPSDSTARARFSVSELAGEADATEEAWEAPQSDRLMGVMVHRLFQVGPSAEGQPDVAAVRSLASRLLRAEERAGLDDPDGLLTIVAAIWMRARERPDVIAALEGIDRVHEMPFSSLDTDTGVERVVRGTIDCLVWKHNDDIAVVELKTGRPRAVHQRQLDVYVRAARTLFPSVSVKGILLYL